MSSPVVTIAKDGSVRMANLLFQTGIEYYLVDERTDEKFSYVADEKLNNPSKLLLLWENLRIVDRTVISPI